MPGILYIVGTPIGNLGDISPRALKALEEVDFIACEDTRVSIKLLNHFGIKKPLISYHAHREKERGQEILEKLLGGQSAALISDAGMPLISDPGSVLVALCKEHHIEMQAIAGPSAFVLALALSGLPSERFRFEGFLPTQTKERRLRLTSLKDETCTMIFYEAPHKIKKTLADFETYFGDREISISRELTKRFEETIRCTISDAISHFNVQEPRGEFVLVLAGAFEKTSEDVDINTVLLQLQKQLAAGVSRKSAIAEIAAQTGLSKNLLYAESLKFDF